jgi:uncharacterized protein YciI
MDFFIYSRGAPGAGEVDDPALDEAHWSYMDRFAGGMIARGPTFAPDRATWNGSLHILSLPSAGAAREFVEREPYNRAGLFADHVIRRFENLIGRTMWESPVSSDDPRFLVLAHGPGPITTLPPERLIVHGALSTPDEGRPGGVVAALQAPTRAAAGALVRHGHFDVEVLDWEFGGRR